MGVNYGLNRVRFTAPLPSGSRVRARFTLQKFEKLAEGRRAGDVERGRRARRRGQAGSGRRVAWEALLLMTMEKQTPRLQLGRIRPRRPARAHEPRDPREGAAGHRRGEGGHHLLLLAAARLSRRPGAQPAPRPAAPRRHLARRQAVLLPPAGRVQREHDRRDLRRPGADVAAVLDAMGFVRARRQPLRRRRRRQGGARVLQRLSRRRGRGSRCRQEIRRPGIDSRAPRRRRSASRASPSTARRVAACSSICTITFRGSARPSATTT